MDFDAEFESATININFQVTVKFQEQNSLYFKTMNFAFSKKMHFAWKNQLKIKYSMTSSGLTILQYVSSFKEEEKKTVTKV